jgi:hypothetical protein
MSVFNHLKNLIRQGKSAVSTPSSDSGSDLSNATRSLVGSNPTQKQASRVEAAARMVEEEREAKKRIPTYAGLERYKLLSKMGEYVSKHSLRCRDWLVKWTKICFIVCFFSGAFSDVYKAVDVNTLQKVAVKVVRKYELSPVQVKCLFKIHLFSFHGLGLGRMGLIRLLSQFNSFLFESMGVGVMIINQQLTDNLTFIFIFLFCPPPLSPKFFGYSTSEQALSRKSK